MPETKDADFTWKGFQEKINKDLVDDLGTFIHRTLVLTNKNWGGIVPERGELTDFDHEILNEAKELPKKVAQSLERFRFKEALSYAMDVARLGNKYLSHTEPWRIIKEDEERVKTILNISLQLSASLSSLLAPFIPDTAQRLAEMLNLAVLKWSDGLRDNLIVPGHKINKAEKLFKKIEDSVIEEQLTKLEAIKQAEEDKQQEVEAQKTNVSFEDFTKLDLRVGTIIDAEKVKKTKKLLKITVDTGIDKRTVVSGIAEFYKPEDIIGKQVSMIVNLAPRKIKGIDSEGMILMAENGKGELVLVSPNNEISPGSVIR